MHSREHVVTNAVDGNFSTVPFYCFISADATNGMASFDIQWSHVTHISLLNLEQGLFNFKMQSDIGLPHFLGSISLIMLRGVHIVSNTCFCTRL